MCAYTKVCRYDTYRWHLMTCKKTKAWTKRFNFLEQEIGLHNIIGYSILYKGTTIWFWGGPDKFCWGILIIFNMSSVGKFIFRYTKDRTFIFYRNKFWQSQKTRVECWYSRNRTGYFHVVLFILYRLLAPDIVCIKGVLHVWINICYKFVNYANCDRKGGSGVLPQKNCNIYTKWWPF